MRSARWTFSTARALFLLLTMILVVACGAGGSETVTRTFEVGDAPQFGLGSGHGDVLISVGPPGEIVVNAEIEDSDNVFLDIESTGDRVIAFAVTKASGNLLGDTAQGSIDFTVTVPPGTELDIGTENGSVTIEGVRGGGRITTQEGAVIIRGASGAYSGGTGQGDVRITDSNGEFNFIVGIGDIEFDGILAEGGHNRFETGGGTALVSIDKSARVSIEAEIETGRLDSTIYLDQETLEADSLGWTLSGSRADPNVRLDVSVGTGAIILRDAN